MISAVFLIETKRREIPHPVDESDNPSFSEFFVERREPLMARHIGRHNVGARPTPPALLEKVGQRLIDQGLKLPPLAARKVAAGLMNPARPR